MSRIIIPVPCHFATLDSVCSTTVARMRAALLLKKPDDLFVLSGDVPYTQNSTTLGAHMQNWLIQNGIPVESICVLRGGVGTFSEARATCETAPYLNARELIVISSVWYLFAGKPIWHRRAKENNVRISFVSVPHTGGLRTYLLYGFLGITVHVANVAGLESYLEKFFTAIQKKRTEGFTANGCA